MLSSTTFFQGGGADEEESESSSSLSAPLLLRSNPDGTISEQDDNDEQAGVPAAANSTGADNNNNMATYHTVGGGGGRSGGSSHSRLPLLLRRCVQWKSAADALPTAFHVVVTNGKICALATVGCYLIFISLWFPFWLLSFLLTEYGVYALVVCTIFFVGRSIIRLIAFPGASQKVTKEIEAEFAKYSVRMIVSASTAMSELASAIIHTLEATVAGAGNKATATVSPHGNIPGLWRRAKMVRDRVLGVYLEVLLYLYQQAPTSCNSNQDAFINKFGNNRLHGDVGTLGDLTMEAERDGRDLMNRLQQLMSLTESLERRNAAGPLLDGSASAASAAIGNGIEEALQTARQLLHVANDLRDFCSSLRPPSSSSDENGENAPGVEGEDGDDIDDLGAAMRRRIEAEGAAGSAWEFVKTGVSSLMGMLDPPPNPSIFGMDVQRGCMLSRYRGARQFWVTRGKGGMIDALHFPAIPTQTNMGTAPSPNNTKAVLYCNPNAGLVEVATGLSLVAGNVPSAEADSNGHGDSWIDYYTSLGFDVYVFNYAGYGRSHGKTICSSSAPANSDNHYVAGIFAKLCRIFRSCFLGFQPTPDTLRADGFDVAEHVYNQFGVEKLVIHGESIGGVAASGAARRLTTTTTTSRHEVSLLICDRTFCNLEAVAQRLVGGWTGYAIRTLTLFSWSTDVAGDFLAAACPKVVANDSSDAIISDEASLKSGVALWKEIHRGIATTKGIGWMKETPLQYRMADFENVCVNDSKYVAGAFLRTQPPTWPTDKHITVEEAFHFAACCKRIGKVATQTQRGMMRDQELSGFADVGGGIEVSNSGSGGVVHSEPLVLEAWKYLATCDGLTGSTLGVAVKRGFDAGVAWLCSGLVFGGQAVVYKASRRRSPTNKGGGLDPNPTARQNSLKVTAADFDNRPPGYTYEERNDGVIHPKPIPEVVERLVFLLETGDESMRHLSHEFQFVLGVLHYMQSRLSSPAAVESALKSRNLDNIEESGVGCFMNLHCGHNNAFTREEKMQLETILEQATTTSQQQEQQHSIV